MAKKVSVKKVIKAVKNQKIKPSVVSKKSNSSQAKKTLNKVAIKKVGKPIKKDIKKAEVNKIVKKDQPKTKVELKGIKNKKSVVAPVKASKPVAQAKNIPTKTVKKNVPQIKATTKTPAISKASSKKLTNVLVPSKPVQPIPTKPNIELKNVKPVVIPKLKTKGVVEYKPDYATSILDSKELVHKNQARYSDNDLKMFQDIILRKIEASKSELNYLQNIISKKDDVGFHDSDNKNFSIEEGGVGLEKEQLTQMARRQIQFIDNLEKALIRIENKTYGICVVTGKLIDKERLKAVPHARLSLEAKMEDMNNKK